MELAEFLCLCHSVICPSYLPTPQHLPLSLLPSSSPLGVRALLVHLFKQMSTCVHCNTALTAPHCKSHHVPTPSPSPYMSVDAALRAGWVLTRPVHRCAPRSITA